MAVRENEFRGDSRGGRHLATESFENANPSSIDENFVSHETSDGSTLDAGR
jgi:hypothetical protein